MAVKVCVVGGTGNISTSIVRLLVERGHDVTCFNRGVSGGPPDGVWLIRGNRTDAGSFERAMRRPCEAPGYPVEESPLESVALHDRSAWHAPCLRSAAQAVAQGRSRGPGQVCLPRAERAISS